ncbi:MAG: hypothetical protein J5846_03070 [Desulfovibrio sp.]|nr:hypothetical protein [Desulfovibrio sp.]
MEEKIQWYQEVLQLEPNSKLFFPLALLLSQANRIPEALQVLQNGLARHDEYLEARLFYIELLYKSGQNAAIAPELQKLQDLFSHYTGFWQAWAAFIASNGNSLDTSALMRFLSLYFTHKDLSLHTVIDKGLQALMQEEVTQSCDTASDALPSSPPAEQPSDASATAPSEESQDAEAADVVAPLAANVADMTAETPESGAAAMPEDAATLTPEQPENDASQATEASAAKTLDNSSEHLESLDACAALSAADMVEAGAFAPEQQAESDSQTQASEVLTEDPRIYADAELGEAGLVERSELGQPETAAAAPDRPAGEEVLDGDALPDEPISLRTRSMAEVLAEQGDIKGALDIYYELEGSAASVEESADLRQRIATLRSLLTPPKETAPAENKPDKSRVISLIEALSERLEARAQQ